MTIVVSVVCVKCNSLAALTLALDDVPVVDRFVCPLCMPHPDELEALGVPLVEEPSSS